MESNPSRSGLILLALAAVGGAVYYARKKGAFEDECTLGPLLLDFKDREHPEDDIVVDGKSYGSPDPWRPLNEEPNIIGKDLGRSFGIQDIVEFALPRRYWSPQTKLYGVSSDVISVRLRDWIPTQGHLAGKHMWGLRIVPIQDNATTTFSIGDSSGPKEHVAVFTGDIKITTGQRTACA
jgi:hypothetical protein